LLRMTRPRQKKTYKHTPELIRLNKFIAATGTCSRRDADAMIEAGRVKVNGKLVSDLGTKVYFDAKVQVDNKLLQGEKKVYILMNKPKNIITSTNDPQGRKTVIDLINQSVHERVYPVGRLDRNTTGVLLLTNDGDLTGKLTHPKFGVMKIYEVKLNHGLNDNDFAKLIKGIELEDGSFKIDKLSYLDPADKTHLGLEIHSGRNRIIRRSFEHLGYEVVKLDRVSFAGLTKKNLARGRWRRLSTKEVAWLKMNKKPR
ncbi:MAG: rRNA pseudouridine synthase, partial [Bacteroidales bacterium]|nr:rRNA pseudouridine synthase [Bacteroidales bacterium]